MALALVFAHSYKSEGADYVIFSTKHDKPTTEDLVTIVSTKKVDGVMVSTPIPTKDTTQNLGSPGPVSETNRSDPNIVNFYFHRKQINLDKTGEDRIISCPSHNYWQWLVDSTGDSIWD